MYIGSDVSSISMGRGGAEGWAGGWAGGGQGVGEARVDAPPASENEKKIRKFSLCVGRSAFLSF